MTRKIIAETINQENIAPYGSMTSILQPEGFSFAGEIHNFYPDRLQMFEQDMPSMSALTVKKPEKMLISAMESHSTTSEVFVCLDADVVIHVTPPTPERPNTEDSKAFFVPRGTAVKLNIGVWHLAPIPVSADLAHIVILLPQRTYADDCRVVNLTKEEQFVIELNK